MGYSWETDISSAECVKKISRYSSDRSIELKNQDWNLWAYQEKGRRGSSIQMDGWTQIHLSVWSFMYILCHEHTCRTNGISVSNLHTLHVVHQQMAFTLQERKQICSRRGGILFHEDNGHFKVSNFAWACILSCSVHLNVLKLWNTRRHV